MLDFLLRDADCTLIAQLTDPLRNQLTCRNENYSRAVVETFRDGTGVHIAVCQVSNKSFQSIAQFRVRLLRPA